MELKNYIYVFKFLIILYGFEYIWIVYGFVRGLVRILYGNGMGGVGFFFEG